MDGLLCGVSQQLGREPLASAVVERPLDGGDRDGAEPGPVLLGDVAVMEDDAFRYAEAAPLPRARERQVKVRGEGVGDAGGLIPMLGASAWQKICARLNQVPTAHLARKCPNRVSESAEKPQFAR